MPEEFPKYKFLALFHDPPWKPWSITGVTKDFLEKVAKEFNVSYYAKSDERHENDGFTLAKIIGGLTDSEIDKYRNIVKNADIFSASMSRQTVRGGQLQRQWKKVNVFNPNYYLELEEKIDTNKILQYIKELHKETSQVSDTSLKYNITYSSMEALWYLLLGEKYVPLADTRVYTYTVFDHDYATVAMTNIISDCDNFSLREECFKGYIVKVDVPGVQSIISKSRKVLDLWGSSWLVSYLAFNTIYPLIRKYGADIVLSPFIGINPFFVSRVIKESNVDISGLFMDLSEIMKYPTQPVMPATVFLALPLDEDLEELYLKAWDNLIEVSDNIESIDKNIIRSLKGKPIMPVRVTKIKVEEAIREFVNDHSGHTDRKYSPLFFSYLIEKVGRSSNIRVNYGVTLYSLATTTTEQAYQNGYNFKHCTNCGILPAVVKQAEVKDDPDLEEREALCYYCYLRRKLHRFAEKLIGKKRQIVPSTIDIANLGNWRKILKKDPKEYGFIMEEEDYGSLPEALKVEDDKVRRQFFYNYTIARRLMLDLNDPKDDVEQKVKEDIRKVNIYYAIVKADGDYVGKKLLRGDLGIKLKDYISKTVMEGYATDISYLPDDKIPTTPDYYFVLSKSLMAVALKDMLEVQKEGFIIYAGGDDLAFLSPILDDKEDLVVIEMVRKTRRNYWGVSNGFNFVGNIPIDAPAVYGRSYAVILTHYKEPFFYSWSVATDIEEEKDNYEGKDVTFILRFRGSYDKEDIASLKSWGEDLETVIKLYECMMKKKALSKSFIRDVMETFNKYDVNDTLYPAFINYLIKRNSEKDCDGLGALKIPNKLRDKFIGVEVVKALKHLIPSQGE